MAVTIFSEDILLICILMAQGDMDMSLDEIIRRFQKYQQSKNRCLGYTAGDFSMAFLRLVLRDLEQQSLGLTTAHRWMEYAQSIRLRDLVWPVLKYAAIWFCDEGEYWCIREELEEDWVDDEGNPPSILTKQLRLFFQCSVNHSTERVRRFLERRVGPEFLEKHTQDVNQVKRKKSLHGLQK